MLTAAMPFGMWQTLWRGALTLLSAPRCPRCSGDAEADDGFCLACLQDLALPLGGLQGDAPLLWCALAPYGGALRTLLLRQRPQPDPAVITALATQLHGCCASVLPGALLVPIPSWKRCGNPLPLRLAGALVQAGGGCATLAPELLQRTRPTVGQHHLGRGQRLSNLRQAFAAPSPQGPARGWWRQRRPLWLVDDILTTGSTALAAAQALQAAGWAVQGVLAIARTPP
jgi:predicted amidophosphoribosyltransferase